MGWNILLATFAIALGHQVKRTHNVWKRMALLGLWILFVPNTLYLVTDVIHVFNYRFIQMTGPFIMLGIGLYATIIVLGPFTFWRATQPVLRVFHSSLVRVSPLMRLTIFLLFSYAVGFAIAMGRLHRTNSWYVFSQPWRVVADVWSTFTDPTAIIVTLFYGSAALVLTMINYAKLRLSNQSQ